MTAFDPWAIDASAGSPAYSAQEARILSTAPFVVGVGSAVGTRTGVRQSGSGTDLLVAAQGSPNMTVSVAPGICIVQGQISTTQGPYTWALDTATNVTISASHATLDRTDLVCVRIRDANFDTSGARDGSVMVVTGTAGGGVPSVPTDASYFILAQISVVHAVTSITSGAITDKRTFYAAMGGFITCKSSSRPSSPVAGQRIWETDTGLERVWNGTFWDPGELTGFVAADIVCSSTTLQNMTGITWAGESNARYIYDIALMYGAGTTGDMKIAWTLPAGANIRTAPINAITGVATAGDTNTAVNLRGDTSTTPSFSIGGPFASPFTYAQLRGWCEIASTAGTVQLQFAQSASDANNTVVNKGTWLRVRRVV